ncbi:hypothetical protein [Tepidibacillus marianensis]|uniref:nucleotide-binding protein n=1 Tax=Tepidibacillus marianensis TaxID=3131995 RepID=UPI0030CF84E0
MGHYGTGKTTLSLNFALNWAKKEKERVAIADLDVNNPYFRSRDWMKTLNKQQIDLIMPDQKIAFAEMPYLPKEIYSVIQNLDRNVIIDVGGHDVGTTVLGSLAEKIEKVPYELWMVINTFRPDMETAEEIIAMLERLQALAKLKVTGLINNTNLGPLTQVQDVLMSEAIVSNVSMLRGIPMIGTTIEKNLYDEGTAILKTPLIPIKRFDSLNLG